MYVMDDNFLKEISIVNLNQDKLKTNPNIYFRLSLSQWKLFSQFEKQKAPQLSKRRVSQL